METKTLYLLYECDQWKSRDSMRLQGVYDENNIEEARERYKKYQEYTDEDMETYTYIETMTLNEDNF